VGILEEDIPAVIPEGTLVVGILMVVHHTVDIPINSHSPITSTAVDRETFFLILISIYTKDTIGDIVTLVSRSRMEEAGIDFNSA
jgi:hypothetical protein